MKAGKSYACGCGCGPCSSPSGTSGSTGTAALLAALALGTGFYLLPNCDYTENPTPANTCWDVIKPSTLTPTQLGYWKRTFELRQAKLTVQSTELTAAVAALGTGTSELA